jgi:phospholipase/lecithinase/hemolysin
MLVFSKLRAILGITLAMGLCATRVSASPAPGTYNQLIVFGDSLSDTGNVLAKTTSYSYITTPRPTTPWYQPGQFTDGTAVTGSNQTKFQVIATEYSLDWDQRLAQLLGISTFTPSSSGGTNYATGGAETGTGNFSGLSFPNMGQQVSNYIASKPSPTPQTLFALWGGGNDLIDACEAKNATAASVAAAETSAVENVSSEIAQLSNAFPGKAINFIWPNVPPLQATPKAQSFSPIIQTALATASYDFQQDEDFTTLELEDVFPNDHIYNLDVYGMFQDVLSNPDFYGFTNTTQSIITATSFSGTSFSATPNFPNQTVNPDQFLFWDQLHPTSAVHNMIGEAAFDLLPEPSSVAILAVTASTIAIKRRSRTRA